MSEPCKVPHVLIIAQSLMGGGAEQVCRGWIELLLQHDVEVTVATLRPISGELRRRLLASSVSLVTLPPGHLPRVRAVSRLLRSGADAALSLLTYPNLILLTAGIRKRNVRLVLSEHSVPSIMLGSQGVSQRVQLRIARLLYRRADHIIAVSHAVATDLRGVFRVSPDRASVVPNLAIQEEVEHRVHAEVRPSDTRADICLVVPARIATAKRPAFAVGVAEELANRGRVVEVRFIGDVAPSSSRVLSELNSSKVNVRIAGWVDDWVTSVPPRSIVLLPSEVEGFGNVLIAAAYAGFRTVAGSMALGVGDAIVPGVTGAFASSDTVEAFADAVVEAAKISPEVHAPAGYFDRFRVAGVTLPFFRALGIAGWLAERRGG